MNAKKQPDIYSPEFTQEKLRGLPRETTPRRVTPAIKRLCRRLAEDRLPSFVPVLPAPSARANAPRENVADTIRVNGGEEAAGWLIWEMRDVLLNAERYACWRSPDGDLLDVSPKPDGEKRILFLAGEEPWNGERTCPVTVPLAGDEPVADYIRAYQAERGQWAKGVTDFKLQKELYLAMIRLSEHLSGGGGKKRAKR